MVFPEIANKVNMRCRLNTFPQASRKKVKPGMTPKEIHRRWNKFRKVNNQLKKKQCLESIDLPRREVIPDLNPFPIQDVTFGVIPNPLDLSWDYTTDLNSPGYPEDDSQLPHIAVAVAQSVLDDQDQAVDGFLDSEGGSRSNRLELMSDHLQNGIVYDVSQRLEDIQELITDPNIHLRRPSAPTLLNSVLVKNKRLDSVSSHIKLRNENGKRKPLNRIILRHGLLKS